MTDLVNKRINGNHMVDCYVDEYDKLLDQKLLKVKEMFESMNIKKEIEVFKSPTKHFRMRANFNIWRDNKNDDNIQNMYYAMFNEEKKVVEITSFPRGTVLMNQLMIQLFEQLALYECLRKKLFEVRFLTTSINEAQIILIYKSQLSSEWKAIATQVAKELNIQIIGRAKKQKIIANENNIEYIKEILPIQYQQNKYNIIYYQTEGAFTQPNATICIKMIEWVMSLTSNCQQEDLLELYCGGGTFTLPLSYHFHHVLATEMNKLSVELAQKAIHDNHITNIKLIKLSSEEFTQAYVGKRIFQRLIDAHINLTEYKLTTVLVDPPRAGLDKDTCTLIATFDKIIYISCNPNTLMRDLILLQSTHDIIHTAVFDQFPYTDHLECGVYLMRKTGMEQSSADRPVHTDSNDNITVSTEIINIDNNSNTNPKINITELPNITKNEDTENTTTCVSPEIKKQKLN